VQVEEVRPHDDATAEDQVGFMLTNMEEVGLMVTNTIVTRCWRS
jgi:hypothetical protein